MATQLFACWSAISDLRIAKKGWAFASGDPALMEYFEIVSRNVHRACVRLTIEKYRGRMGAETAPRDSAGNIIHDPSDDEPPPSIPKDTFLAQESFPALDPKWATVPNPNTPERTAPASSRVAPVPKAHRVDSSSTSRGDQGFPSRHAMASPASCLVTVSTEQVQLAGREPTRG